MDKMCNKSEVEDLIKSNSNVEESNKVKTCRSPVFKCVYQSKGNKGTHLDSSDYDIPSYQINQSLKSRASNKNGSETNETLLPFSPIFSPLPVTPAAQVFQPSVINSLETVAKNSDKVCKSSAKSFPHPNIDIHQTKAIFDGLGLTDKDISWVSSMASPPPKQIPGSVFNTVEKATFLPEENFLNIQPRALFSPNFDDDFGCHPISFTSECDDEEEAYKSNVRLSDVCASLKLLEVKSSDPALDNSVPDFSSQDESLISPVIKPKRNKPESVKKKSDILVMSPNDKDKYEFSVDKNTKNLEINNCKSKNGNNFLEDDSFQSMSFSCIDELCKTLVTEASSISSTSKVEDCNKTLVNINTVNLMPNNIQKKFYNSKTATEVLKVSSMDNLHSYAKTLAEGDTSIPLNCLKGKSIADKGIIRLDVLNKNQKKVDQTKRSHSELSVEKEKCPEKKFKTMDIENESWENVKEYLSESQLNVSDGEIFRTVENLEKTLITQQYKNVEKPNISIGDVIRVSEKNKERELKELKKVSNYKEFQLKTSGIEINAVDISIKNVTANSCMVFTTASGSKIPVSENALIKAKEILKDCDGNGKVIDCNSSFDELEKFYEKSSGAVSTDYIKKFSIKGFSTGSGKQITPSAEALEKAKTFFLQNEMLEGTNLPQIQLESFEKSKENFKEKIISGFSTGSGKQIQVSAKSLVKAKAFMTECEESLKDAVLGEITAFPGSFSESPVKKFSTILSEERKSYFLNNDKNQTDAFENPKNSSKSFTTNFKNAPIETLENVKSTTSEWKVDLGQGIKEISCTFSGFSTGSGKKINVSASALEKAKNLMTECEENTKQNVLSSKSFSIFQAPNKSIENDKVLESYCPNKSKKTLGELTPVWKATLPFHRVPGLNTTAKKVDEIENKPEHLENVHRHTDRLETSSTNTTEILKTENKVLTSSEMDGMQEFDEIVPSWLHVYKTSPSMICDRLDFSPLIADENEKSSRSAREHVVKSPVLGAGDRYYGKKKKRKGRVKKEKDTPSVFGFEILEKTGGKRTLNSTTNFTVPFKKVKLLEQSNMSCFDIKGERTKKRKEQEKIIKEKQKVKPKKGLHLSKKCSEKQMSWAEAVGGSLPGVFSDEFLKSKGVRQCVLDLNLKNILSYKFNGEDFFGPNCSTNIEGIPVGEECSLILDDANRFGVEELKRAFLASPSVQPTLVPNGWVENHYKWIVWKLVHYERSFPQHFGGNCLSPENITHQLKYRYDREIDRCERSALKKILERDDTAAKRLVLCVCGIEEVSVDGMTGYELNLTDGWYSCPARSDLAFTRLIQEKKVVIGTKLMTQGAVLNNCEQGISPLEMDRIVHIKISTNSTRRVKWDTKLGFQKNPKNFPVSLSSIMPQGGSISRIDVILVRIYPKLYMERTSDGHHVTRNRRSEEKAEAEYRRIREQRIEAIYNEVLTEMRRLSKCEVKKSHIYSNNLEPVEEMDNLSESEASQLNQNDRFGLELSEKVERRLEKEKLCKRNVTEFFRAKIVDLRKPVYNNPAVLSVWNPNEDVTSLFSEGRVVSLMNVNVSNSSRVCRPLQINTSRQTHYRAINQNVKYPARKLTQLKDVSSKFCPAFEEVDLVGMIAVIRDISYGSRMSQVVYLTDLRMNFAGIVFWGSCKDYGWDNVLKIQSIVACSNLQWNKNFSLQEVPSLHVNENSVFTENPKHAHLKEEIERLKRDLPQEITSFLSECEEKLTTKLEEIKWKRNSNKSSPACDLSVKEGRIVQSVVTKGFESKPTASSTPIKPFVAGIASDGAEPSPIQKKIEKLQNYGEPPSLIPLIVRNNVKKKLKKKG